MGQSRRQHSGNERQIYSVQLSGPALGQAQHSMLWSSGRATMQEGHGSFQRLLVSLHLGNHVIYEPVLVPNAKVIKLLFVMLLEDVLKNLHKPPVVRLQDCIFGGQVQRPAHGTARGVRHQRIWYAVTIVCGNNAFQCAIKYSAKNAKRAASLEGTLLII